MWLYIYHAYVHYIIEPFMLLCVAAHGYHSNMCMLHACLVYCDNDSLHNSLVRCSVTSKGAKAIADGLHANTSLKSLE